MMQLSQDRFADGPRRPGRCARGWFGLACWLVALAGLPASTFAATYSLGLSQVVVGSTAGAQSVVLAVSPVDTVWTNVANAAWLHLAAGGAAGAGSTNLVFSYDANPGGTRVGTISIAGLNLSVTQAGASYAAAGVRTPLVASGLGRPFGLALDSSGNVYCSDLGTDDLKVWGVASNSVRALPPSGQGYFPQGIAVDAAGNVYFLDTDHGALQQWSPATDQVTTLVPNGLSPGGLAVDGAGNVFIADPANNAIKEWVAAGQTLTNLGVAGLNSPNGVAVDVAGNVYVADSGNNAVKVWSPVAGTVSTLLTNLHEPYGVAVDGGGNVYVADTLSPNGAVVEWVAASNLVVTLATGVGLPTAVAVDGTGNVYVADGGGTIQELPVAWVDVSPVALGAAAGAGVLPAVVPAGENLRAPFTPQTGQPWLTVTGSTNGVVAYAHAVNSAATARMANFTVLGQAVPVTQSGAVYGLSTTNVEVLATAGSSNLVFSVSPSDAMWTASSGAGWLHWLSGSTDGTGSRVVSFSYDDNPGAGRTGTLLIADLMITVTQAPPVFTLSVSQVVESAVGGSVGVGLSVVPGDGLWTNTANAAWLKLAGGASTTTGSGSGTNWVYFDDNPSAARTGTVSMAGLTLTVAQLAPVFSLATNLVHETAVGGTAAVTLTATPAVGLWTNAAVSSWLHFDGTNQMGQGSGPVLVRYDDNPGISRTGTVLIAGRTLTVVQDAPVFTLATNQLFEPVSAGADVIRLAVVPQAGEWTATANASWLHLAATNGAGNTNLVFTFDNNAGPGSRSGTISIAGLEVTVHQAPPIYVLGMARQVVGPSAGTYSVVLSVTPNFGVWTAAANTSWMHLVPGFSTGTGGTNVRFTVDANSGASRSGTLTIAGQTLTIQQGAGTYVPAGVLTPLVGGLANPYSVAVDPHGNVLIANTLSNRLDIWSPTGGSPKVLVTNLHSPEAVAVDNNAYVYLADTFSNGILVWSPVTSVATNLSISGLYYPGGLAVDASGNIYIADTYNNALKMWSPTNGQVTTLAATGLQQPYGLAVDMAGNVYVANYGGNSILKWSAAAGTLGTLVPSSFFGPATNHPFGVAVDGGGNVYFSQTGSGIISKWVAASGQITNVIMAGLQGPAGIALDTRGNLYVADVTSNAVLELPQAWVDSAPLFEPASAGGDAFSPVMPVENLTGPFAPTSSDPSWLFINATDAGIVQFGYTINGHTQRVGHITVLGRSVSVTQAAAASPTSVGGYTQLPGGAVRFSFTNWPGATFSVLAATNLATPTTNWMRLGSATNISGGLFEFTTQPTSNSAAMFYRLRSP